MTSTLQIKKKRPFSAVPDDILTNKTLSAEARLALAYMVGRPDGWVFYVSQIQHALGFSESRWARLRKELVAAGYYSQSRGRDEETGKWVWVNVVTDVPTIPPKPMDGDSMDGKPIHGKRGDKTKDFYQEELSKGTPPPSPAEKKVAVVFAGNFPPTSHTACRKLLEKVEVGDQQQLLDDLAGWIALQALNGQQVRTIPGVLRAMIARYVVGEWVPENCHIGMEMRSADQQQQNAAQVASRPPADLNSKSIEKGREALQKIRRQHGQHGSVS